MVHARVIRYGDIDKRFPDRDPDNRMYKRRVLAEGDSWFTFGAVPGGNLLFHIQLSQPTALVTIAKPGDTITHMGDPDRMLQLRRLVAVRQFAYAWDAMLLSGGGNDLIDSAPNLLRRPDVASADAKDFVDPLALGQFLLRIQNAYGAIVALRDSAGSQSKGVPIYVHTYDYPTPRDSPARFLGAGVLGPWLYPAFILASVPEQMWMPLADYLLDQLAGAILALDADTGTSPLPGVRVVDTRNTLQRARLGTISGDGDWVNEIHPNTKGYRKLGEKLSARISLP